jgi:hypothetical protein
MAISGHIDNYVVIARVENDVRLRRVRCGNIEAAPQSLLKRISLLPPPIHHSKNRG